ncbi:MAG: hypothetical protein CVU38_09590 [Chloroflexi bacterium HGW-Chloroflexi-1]|nr:MAG: hypothetical protein CVU38_09590 [Chloroflexi bacterium HGW-Chloroflexi-1]
MIVSRSLKRPRAFTWTSTDLLMVAVILIWGINFSVVKLALRDFSPLAFNAVRFGLATAVMVAILVLRGESFRLARRDLLPIVFLGLSGHTLYQLVFIFGLAETIPANSALLMATSPIFVAIYGRVLGIERTNRLMWAGIALSFAGILLVIGGDGELSLGGGTLRGDLLILAAAMLWAAYTTASMPLLTRYSPVKVTALSMVVGTIPFVVISTPALLRQDWHATTVGGWGGLLYSAVFAVVVGYVIWYTSVQRVGNARTAVYSNLIPVVAGVIGWLALGDRLTPLQLVGAAVVLAGIMLTRRGRMRQ